MEPLRPTPDQAAIAEHGPGAGSDRGRGGRRATATCGARGSGGSSGRSSVTAWRSSQPRRPGRAHRHGRVPRRRPNACSPVGRRGPDGARVAARGSVGVVLAATWTGTWAGLALLGGRRRLVGRVAPAGPCVRRVARGHPLHRRLPGRPAAAAAGHQDRLRQLPAGRAVDAGLVPRERGDRDEARALRRRSRCGRRRTPRPGRAWALLALGVLQIVTDVTLSTKSSDWKKFRRERRRRARHPGVPQPDPATAGRPSAARSG